MDTPIDIQLAQYSFKFRPLFWREEFALKSGKRDPRRVVLAAALTEVSGLPVNDFGEAYRVLDAVSTTLIERMFIIYKGTLSDDRKFTTQNLYKAPEPSDYVNRVEMEEDRADKKVDVVMQRMEEQFTKEELEEAKEVDRQILAGAQAKGGYRGAVPKIPDEEDPENPLGGWKKKAS